MSKFQKGKKMKKRILLFVVFSLCIMSIALFGDDRKKASCFNFAKGGNKYDFEIKEDGKVYYWLNGVEKGEFSPF